MLQVLGVSSVLLRRVFSRRGLAASMLVLLCLIGGANAQTPAQRLLVLSNNNRPLLTLNLMGGALPSQITFTRSSSATTSFYTDAAGATVTTYSTNVPRFTGGAIPGLLIERSATNFLLNSAAPVTQTTGSLGTGSYDLLCNGTGSVTSSLGTATATGTGALTCNSSTYQTIAVTVAGTLTFTVSGTVNWFDLQNVAFPSFPTSHIVTAGATATRSADVASLPVGAIPGWSPLAGAVLARFSPNESNAQGRLLGTAGAVEFALAQGGSFFDGASVTVTTAGLANAFAVNRAAGSWSPSGAYVETNGTSSASSSSTPNATNLAAVTTIYLGSQSGSASLMNGIVQKLAFYRSLSPAQQVLLTSANGGF